MPKPPSVRRQGLFALACAHVVLASGAAYGWTALRPVLLAAGFFKRSPGSYNTVATLGISANALCKLPLGVLLDAYGPRVTSCVGAVLLIGGSLGMAFCDRESLWQVGASYFAIGVSGPFVQMPTFQFCEMYGDRRSKALSTLVTCFELSTGVFFLFNMLHSYLHVGVPALFTGFGAVGVFIFVTAALLWPDGPICQEASSDDDGSSLGDEEAVPLVEVAQQQPPSLWSMVFSAQFAYSTAFLAMHIFRQGFVLATVGPQAEHFFEQGKADFLANAFSIILPMGFVPMALLTASGLAGYLLKRKHVAFTVVTVLSMAYGLAFLFRNQYVWLAAFAVFPLARQLVFSCFFGHVSARFGYASFGRLSGIASTLAGVVQLGQAPLIQAVRDNRWGLTWWNTDIVLGLLPLGLLVYPLRMFLIRLKQKGAQKVVVPELLRELLEDDPLQVEDFDTSSNGTSQGGNSVPVAMRRSASGVMRRSASGTKWDLYSTSMPHYGSASSSPNIAGLFDGAVTTPPPPPIPNASLGNASPRYI